MANSSKAKGYRFEKEIQDMAREHDPEAKRAWGSDGRSLGHGHDVDLVIFDQPWQAKRRKRIASYVLPPENCLGTIIRQDRDIAYAVVPLSWLLEVMERDKKR